MLLQKAFFDYHPNSLPGLLSSIISCLHPNHSTYHMVSMSILPTSSLRDEAAIFFLSWSLHAWWRETSKEGRKEEQTGRYSVGDIQDIFGSGCGAHKKAVSERFELFMVTLLGWLLSPWKIYEGQTPVSTGAEMEGDISIGYTAPKISEDCELTKTCYIQREQANNHYVEMLAQCS